MLDLSFADAAIRQTLDEIEARLGDELGPETGRKVAGILFMGVLSYLVPCHAESIPAGPVEVGHVLAEIANLVKHGFSTLQEVPLEVELVLYRGDERVVGVRTGTLVPPPPDSKGVN